MYKRVNSSVNMWINYENFSKGWGSLTSHFLYLDLCICRSTRTKVNCLKFLRSVSILWKILLKTFAINFSINYYALFFNFLTWNRDLVFCLNRFLKLPCISALFYLQNCFVEWIFIFKLKQKWLTQKESFSKVVQGDIPPL